MGTVEKESLSSALSGKTRRAVLALFYGRPTESFYVRKVFRDTGMSHGSVQRELKRLADVGILVRYERGKQVFYRANRACPIFEELRNLTAKTAGVADVLRRALTPLGDRVKLAFIYGREAKDGSATSSEVDLLVVADTGESEILQVVRGAELDLQCSVKCVLLGQDEFSRLRKERGGFLSRVLNGNEVLVIGTSEDT